MTFTATGGIIESRNGIRIIPDRESTTWPAERMLPTIGQQPPARAVDEALEQIRLRYGNPTAGIVAMQLEYPEEQTTSASARTAARLRR